MARLTTNGLDDLMLTLDQIGDMPDDVLGGMLDAAADVFVAAQKRKGAAYKVQDTGMTIESIKKSRPRRTKDGGSISIYPQGERQREHPKTGTTSITRNAEIAFVNEYGKRGQPPRPFIREANEECTDEAIQAAADVYGAWLESKNL